MDFFRSLTKPKILNSRAAVLEKPSPVPAERGLYAWFFDEIPGVTPTDGCHVQSGLTLLYVGISPKNTRSRQTLRKRITYHYRGNAEGSTLRLSLGALLAEQSGFPLRRVGSGKRMTFTHVGEQWLDAWMEANAFVCWVEHPEPWEVEQEFFQTLSLPLNIQHNRHHPFSGRLQDLRAEAKRGAREQPIAREDNQIRRA
jgi:hypothetical protein